MTGAYMGNTPDSCLLLSSRNDCPSITNIHGRESRVCPVSTSTSFSKMSSSAGIFQKSNGGLSTLWRSFPLGRLGENGTLVGGYADRQIKDEWLNSSDWRVLSYLPPVPVQYRPFDPDCRVFWPPSGLSGSLQFPLTYPGALRYQNNHTKRMTRVAALRIEQQRYDAERPESITLFLQVMARVRNPSSLSARIGLGS